KALTGVRTGLDSTPSGARSVASIGRMPTSSSDTDQPFVSKKGDSILGPLASEVRAIGPTGMAARVPGRLWPALSVLDELRQAGREAAVDGAELGLAHGRPDAVAERFGA